MLQGKHITFSYSDSAKGKIDVLKDVSFEIREHDFIGLIGTSGSGKTTLIKHLNGLLKAESGEIFFNGENIYSKKYPISKLRKEVGLVFQYPEQQLFGRTILKDVMYGPLNLGMSEEEAEKSAVESLELVGISKEYYHLSPMELSGGQKRCVAIAGVLAMQPEILVLDEPAAGLDPETKNEIFELLCRIRKATPSICVRSLTTMTAALRTMTTTWAITSWSRVSCRTITASRTPTKALTMIWMRMPAPRLTTSPPSSLIPSTIDRIASCVILNLRGFAEWKIKNSIRLRSALPPRSRSALGATARSRSLRPSTTAP